MTTLLSKLLRGLALLVTLGTLAWAIGALLYDFPWGRFALAAALVFTLVMVFAALRTPGWWKKIAVILGGCALVAAWWLTLRPSNERDWQADVDRTAWAEIKGDEVTIHHVRNFDYRTETDFTPRWETRSVRLSQLTGADIAINYWGSPYMAHPIISFQFTDAPPLCFSIETRKEKGEAYSAIGGLYRQYELIYLAADERDVLRVRTNFRKGEDVYLYRTTADAAQARERFLEYLKSINWLREHPRWYNAITTNCTTTIRDQHPAAQRPPWDWRILVNGKGDELMYERRTIATDGLPFGELRKRARINSTAFAANDAPDFSRLIRAGRPGFQ